MQTALGDDWAMFQPDAYFTSLSRVPSGRELRSTTERMFEQVFRRTFETPGVALLSLGESVTSTELRAFMVNLKGDLDKLYHQRTHRHLGFISMGRFDQQATTKFHLDGSPDEAYLLLGYEPTEVASSLRIADYTRAAYEWGIFPKTLLTARNPMYPGHERELLPFVTPLEPFDPSAAQIVLLNNSSLPFDSNGTNVLGVMHQATIPIPSSYQKRVVNSTMIGSIREPEEEKIDRSRQDVFVETRELAGQV
jgi:hypothetical protein